MPNGTYPEKVIIYDLCRFLIGKKLTPEGKGLRRPMEIKLQSFNSVLKLDQIQNTTERLKKINDLKHELEQLSCENIPETLIPLIEIKNADIFDDFSNNFEQNKEIILIYDRLGIEKYHKFLQAGDQRRTEGENYDKLVLDCSGKFKYRGKEMIVRENESKGSLHLNLCLLMFGHPLTFIDEETGGKIDIFCDSVYEEYKIGDPVNADLIIELIINKRERLQSPTVQADKFRPIRDTVRNLNKRAKSELGMQIFEYKNLNVKVIQV